MNIREKVLIVEDEKSIAHFISTILSSNGYETLQARTGAEATAMLSSHCPDLVILDLGLPDMDGMQVLRSLRTWSSLPVVVVSARSHESDKVAALDAGADDYLTKPFGTAELLARVRTAIRHTRTTSPSSEIAQRGTYTVGDLMIDYNKHQVLVRGENVHLTLSEFRIVALLGKYAGKTLTYDYLIKELWGPRAGGDNQILRVNMANIRRKIEKNPAQPEYLFTEVGVGYRLAEAENESPHTQRDGCAAAYPAATHPSFSFFVRLSDAKLLLERRNHLLILRVGQMYGFGVGDGKAAAKLKAALVLRDDMEMQVRVGVAKRPEVELGAAPQLFDRAGSRRQIGHKVRALLIVALAQLLLVGAERQYAAPLVRLVLEQVQRTRLHIANLERDRFAALMMFVTVETAHCKPLLCSMMYLYYTVCPL